MAEVYTLRPLFPGSSENDQLLKICSVLGTPSATAWPEGAKLATQIGFRWPTFVPTSLETLIPMASAEGIAIMNAMMQWDPNKRMSTARILQDPYFQAANVPEVPEANNKLPQLPNASSGFSDARKPVGEYRPPQQQHSGGGFFPPANDGLSSKGGWRGSRSDDSNPSLPGSKASSALPPLGGGGGALPPLGGGEQQQGRNEVRRHDSGSRKSPGNRYLKMARYQPGQPMPNLPAVRPAMGSAVAPMPAVGMGTSAMSRPECGPAPPRPDALPQVGGPKPTGYFSGHAARMFG